MEPISHTWDGRHLERGRACDSEWILSLKGKKHLRLEMLQLNTQSWKPDLQGLLCNVALLQVDGEAVASTLM